MPKSCCISFCTNNRISKPHLSYYMIPSEATEPERRSLWLQAIRREDESGKLWHPRSDYNYVCSQHFRTGKKVNKKDHPDYVPSVFPKRPDKGKSSVSRFERVQNRSASKSVLGGIENMVSVSDREGSELETSADATPSEVSDIHSEVTPEQLHNEIRNLRQERDAAIKNVATLTKQTLTADSVKDDDTACRNMTGLNYDVFEKLFAYMKKFIAPTNLIKYRIPAKDQFFVVLLKLRQNPSTELLSHVMGVSHTTVLDMFARWIDLLYTKTTFLIHWPDRECMRSTTPPDMKKLYPHLSCIIDCFEIRIDQPRKLQARAKTYSSYKKWCTVKYLIACSPAGSITFLSKGWGGRASDVEIVRKSGFLSHQYHHPQDQILADRGFLIQDDLALYGSQLVMPAFTRGKPQMPGKDVEESRVKSNIRIHIERVIGVLKNRFSILDGPLPLRIVKSLKEESQDKNEASIDKIVHVCAALVNMGEGVVYKDS